MIPEIIEWIETNPFTKPGICGCDFKGDWLGDGICISCRHSTEEFDETALTCKHPRNHSMGAREMKEEILNYLRGLV